MRDQTGEFGRPAAETAAPTLDEATARAEMAAIGVLRAVEAAMGPGGSLYVPDLDAALDDWASSWRGILAALDAEEGAT